MPSFEKVTFVCFDTVALMAVRIDVAVGVGEPVSVGVGDGAVEVGPVRVGVGVGAAVTVKVALLPAITAMLTGCWVMAGATSTVRTASELVMAPARLVTTTE